MAKKMQTTIVGYIGTPVRILPSFLANQKVSFEASGLPQNPEN